MTIRPWRIMARMLVTIIIVVIIISTSIIIKSYQTKYQ